MPYKLSVAFQDYINKQVIARGLASKTLDGYANAEKLAIGFFGNSPIENIATQDVIKFYEHLGTWQKPDTVRGNIICLRAVIRFAKKRGFDVIDPDDIIIPRRQKQDIEWLTIPEVDAFISAVDTPRRGYCAINRRRNRVMAEFLFETGLRVGEMCKLNKNSIRNRQFTVVGKSKNARPCFITAKLEGEIQEYLKLRHDDSPALFVSNQTGKRITPGTVRRVFRNACNRSDFEGVHPHTMRHSLATSLLDVGTDIAHIGEILGHESYDTTKMYLHVTNPKLHSVYDSSMEKIAAKRS